MWLNPLSHNLVWLLNPVLCWFECLRHIRAQRNRATCLSKNSDASINLMNMSSHANPRWWLWVTCNKSDKARGSWRILEGPGGSWIKTQEVRLRVVQGTRMRPIHQQEPFVYTLSCMFLYDLSVAVIVSCWINSFLKYFYSFTLWTTAPSSGQSLQRHLLQLTFNPSVLHICVTVLTDPTSTDSSVSYVCAHTHLSCLRPCVSLVWPVPHTAAGSAPRRLWSSSPVGCCRWPAACRLAPTFLFCKQRKKRQRRRQKKH